MAYFGFSKRIRDAIIAGIQDCGDAIFATSQGLVPVDTGHLKKSGRTRKLPNGVQITYRTPYAAAVEFGFPRHSERVRRHSVRAHYRKYHHFRSIVNVRTGQRQTHILGPLRMKHGVPTRKLIPINIKRKMRNKIYVPAHQRGPFTRHDVVGRQPEYYLTDAIANHYPDVMLYIQRRL